MSPREKRQIQFSLVMLFLILPAINDLQLMAHTVGVVGLGCMLMDYTDRKTNKGTES